MIADRVAPFDLVFLDAEKAGYPAYLDAVMELSRPGTLIVADNVVRGGAVLEPDSADPNVRGAREFHALFAEDERLSATVLQSVGSKGYDGLTIAVVG